MNCLPNRVFFLKLADAVIGSALCRLLSRSLSWRDHHEVPMRIPPDRLERILVIRPGGIGDMILLLPLIKFIQDRCPRASVHVVCEKRNVPVLELAGMADKALIYDSNPFLFLARLIRHKYDVAIDSEQFHHFSAIFALLSGAPFRIGFKVNPIRNPLYTHLIGYDLDGLESAQFEHLLEPLGFGESPAGIAGFLSSHLPFGPASDADVPAGLQGRRIVFVHAGSSVECKQWPPENYACVAAGLFRKTGCGIALAGNRSETRIAARIEKLLRAEGVPCENIAGRMSLLETAQALRRCSLFLGGDSGLAHLAAALDVPSVTLFGPSDHRKWAHKGSKHKVVFEPLPCAPCFLFGYNRPCRSLACMKRISAERVLDACLSLLGTNSPSPRPA